MIKVQYVVTNGDDVGETFVKTHEFRPMAGDRIRHHLVTGLSILMVKTCVIMEPNPHAVDMIAYCEGV